MKPPSRPWVAPLIAVLVVGAGVGVLWLSGALRSQKADPAPEAVEPDDEWRELDLGEESARAKKLPEYADVAGPTRPRPPYTDQQITRFLELADHPNRWIRFTAIDRLSEVTGPRREEAINRIVRGLKDPTQIVRITAMHGIRRANAKDRIPELLPFLNSPSRNEREVAQHALKNLGHPVEE